jgi:outer membrane cobalamin receptor
MRNPFPRVITLGFILLAPLACASAGTASGGSGPITRADLEHASMRDAYEVVQRLRPAWLQTRGRISIQSTTAQNPVVYVDNIRYGDPGSLRQVSVDAIDEIRYMGASEATTRYGTGHAGGVILVTTRGGSPQRLSAPGTDRQS